MVDVVTAVVVTGVDEDGVQRVLAGLPSFS